MRVRRPRHSCGTCPCRGPLSSSLPVLAKPQGGRTRCVPVGPCPSGSSGNRLSRPLDLLARRPLPRRFACWESVMSQRSYDEQIATIDERIEQLRARRRDDIAHCETGERKARNRVCHAIGETALATYGAKWQTLDFARLGDLLMTELPARRERSSRHGREGYGRRRHQALLCLRERAHPDDGGVDSNWQRGRHRHKQLGVAPWTVRSRHEGHHRAIDGSQEMLQNYENTRGPTDHGCSAV